MRKSWRGIVAVGLLCSGSVAGAQEDVAASPLDDIAQEMKVSANQLSKKVTAKPAQQPQQGAIDKLDALILKLEEERKKLRAGGGTTANPTMPADQSTIMKGPGGMGDLQGVRDQGDRWGDLPAHERDRILQSLTEGFPPHYQAILEAYYKRLAIEKPTDDADAPVAKPRLRMNSVKPTAKPAAAMKPKSPASKGGQ